MPHYGPLAFSVGLQVWDPTRKTPQVTDAENVAASFGNIHPMDPAFGHKVEAVREEYFDTPGGLDFIGKLISAPFYLINAGSDFFEHVAELPKEEVGKQSKPNHTGLRPRDSPYSSHNIQDSIIERLTPQNGAQRATSSNPGSNDISSSKVIRSSSPKRRKVAVEDSSGRKVQNTAHSSNAPRGWLHMPKPTVFATSEVPKPSTIPIPVKVQVELCKKSFLKSINTESPLDILVNIFYNGEFTHSKTFRFGTMRSSYGEDKAPSFSGRRVETTGEVPFVIFPQAQENAGSNTRTVDFEHRWTSINQKLLMEADAWGRDINYDSCRSPIGEYLEELSKLPFPKSAKGYTQAGNKQIGIIDVVVALGRTVALSSAGSLQAPVRKLREGRIGKDQLLVVVPKELKKSESDRLFAEHEHDEKLKSSGSSFFRRQIASTHLGSPLKGKLGDDCEPNEYQSAAGPNPKMRDTNHRSLAKANTSLSSPVSVQHTAPSLLIPGGLLSDGRQRAKIPKHVAAKSYRGFSSKDEKMEFEARQQKQAEFWGTMQYDPDRPTSLSTRSRAKRSSNDTDNLQHEGPNTARYLPGKDKCVPQDEGPNPVPRPLDKGKSLPQNVNNDCPGNEEIDISLDGSGDASRATKKGKVDPMATDKSSRSARTSETSSIQSATRKSKLSGAGQDTGNATTRNRPSATDCPTNQALSQRPPSPELPKLPLQKKQRTMASRELKGLLDPQNPTVEVAHSFGESSAGRVTRNRKHESTISKISEPQLQVGVSGGNLCDSMLTNEGNHQPQVKRRSTGDFYIRETSPIRTLKPFPIDNSHNIRNSDAQEGMLMVASQDTSKIEGEHGAQSVDPITSAKGNDSEETTRTSKAFKVPVKKIEQGGSSKTEQHTTAPNTSRPLTTRTYSQSSYGRKTPTPRSGHSSSPLIGQSVGRQTSAGSSMGTIGISQLPAAVKTTTHTVGTLTNADSARQLQKRRRVGTLSSPTPAMPTVSNATMNTFSPNSRGSRRNSMIQSSSPLAEGMHPPPRPLSNIFTPANSQPMGCAPHEFPIQYQTNRSGRKTIITSSPPTAESSAPEQSYLNPTPKTPSKPSKQVNNVTPPTCAPTTPTPIPTNQNGTWKPDKLGEDSVLGFATKEMCATWLGLEFKASSGYAVRTSRMEREGVFGAIDILMGVRYVLGVSCKKDGE